MTKPYPRIAKVNGHFHCTVCSKEWDENTRACPDCLQQMSGQGHGHNRKMKNTHFDKCDVATECRNVIRDLENAGRLDTPQMRDWAKWKLQETARQPVIDYQVHGHPNFDKDFKHPEYINTDDE